MAMALRVSDGKDIVEELNLVLGSGLDPTVVECNLLIKHALVERAIAEIQFLRSMAGAVTQGESFGESKKAAKTIWAKKPYSVSKKRLLNLQDVRNLSAARKALPVLFVALGQPLIVLSI